MRRVMRRQGVKGQGVSSLWLALALLGSSPALAQAAQPGITTGELVRQAAIVVAVITVALLIAVEFVFRKRLPRSSYYLLLFMGLMVFPAFVMTGATTTVFEQTKTVASCSSCHVMEPFVADMRHPESATLAARHYRHRWIETQQCYNCHTTYGAHGTLEGKRDGFRHWFLYVTRSYHEPIRYTGSFPNVSCFGCHAGAPGYEEVPSHQALEGELAADRMSCTACHGPPHPAPGERTPLALQFAPQRAATFDAGAIVAAVEDRE